jgi:hypothetical protein
VAATKSVFAPDALSFAICEATSGLVTSYPCVSTILFFFAPSPFFSPVM